MSTHDRVLQVFYEAVAWEMYSHKWHELDGFQRADVILVGDRLAATLRRVFAAEQE